jgi:sec-independent protein translocase protein TatB
MLGMSPLEFLAIMVIALLVFGPDKLPKLAADAARLLRELRRMAQGARRDLQESLGPELGDLNLSDLNPATFVRKNLLDPIEDEVEGIRRDVNGVAGGKPRSKPAGATRGDDSSDPPPPAIDADAI